MNTHDPALFDRIRAWADGTLAPDEARRLEATLAADPDLRLAAEEYRAVHRMTETALAPPPAPRLTFEELERRIEADAGATSGAATSRRMRWGAAAAAVVLLAVAAWLASRGPDGVPAPHDAPLLLASIPAEASAPSGAETADLAPRLAGYRPVEAERIRWLASREDARAVAGWTGRPILVYVAFEGCPYCVEMDRTTLRDREVLDLADRFVPLQVDAARLPRDVVQGYFAKGWPYFAVERPDGTEIASFPGRRDGAAFRERLAAALEGATGAALAWERVDAAAARGALRSARDRAAAAPDDARRELEAFAARLPAGAVADDVSLVLARWTSEGRFPDLRFGGAP
jgi:hypothetical protein